MNEQVLGFLGLMRRAGALAVGAEDAFDMARENKARILMTASDSAANTVSAMKNAAALAVLDTGFALALCQKLELADLIPQMEERLAREKKRKAKKEARKEAKKEPQAPAGARTSGAVRRIAEKKGNPGSGKTGSAGAKRPAEGRNKSPRVQKPRVTAKRGN